MKLDIVAYHYVRPTTGVEFPGIKALDLEAFRRQIAYLAGSRTMVETADILACLAGEGDLPDTACWLTFDDGYKDHIDFAAPILAEHGIKAAFFPVAAPVLQGRLLDVNAIQHIQARIGDPDALLSLLKSEMAKHGLGQGDWDRYQRTVDTRSRWDSPAIRFFKSMLQKELPEAVRSAIVSALFERAVGVPEAEFAKRLYCSGEELRQLAAAGHTIGSHTATHRWLNRMSAAEQGTELRDSMAFMDRLGIAAEGRVLSYPFGGYDADTLALTESAGFALAVTTRPEAAELRRETRFRLSRWDTNDLPQ